VIGREKNPAVGNRVIDYGNHKIRSPNMGLETFPLLKKKYSLIQLKKSQSLACGVN